MRLVHHEPAAARTTPLATPFGPRSTRYLTRWLGALLLVAGLTGGVSLLFPAAPYATTPLALAVSAVAALGGTVLLTGAFDDAGPKTAQLIVAGAIVLTAVGVYAGGSPSSGAVAFFFWVAPYAFAFFTTRQAAAQYLLVAASYAAVLALQVHEHPAIGSAGLLAGAWVIVVLSVGAIGVLVRHLGRTVRDADRRFRRGFEDSPFPAAFLSLDLELLEVNSALCALLERSRDDLLGRRLADLLDPADDTPPAWLRSGPDGETAESDVRFLRPDGSPVWTQIAASLVSPEIGPAYRFCQLRDVTEHRVDRDKLAHQAIHDPLTGLHNRTLLLDRAGQALARRGGRPGAVGMILLDLDQFKMVNDSLGHAAGDAVLTALVPQLVSVISASDTLARLGGDEFVILCDNLTGPLDAIDRATRLADAVRHAELLPGTSYVATASIGVALSNESTCDAISLLRDADAAMYRAKAGGRDRIEMFDRSIRYETMRRLQLEHDLRSAIAAGELLLEYQPIVDARSGQPVALEALTRWDHPSRGRIPPDEFIPLAEETGLAVDLGDWVLRTAIEQLGRWQLVHLLAPPLKVTVNVSGHQLAVPGFADRVAELLRAAPIAPGSLGIEITESVIIDVAAAHDTLEALRGLGVVVLLDDFGTGYSSLAYLEQFPIDVLKIDRSFVVRLDEVSPRAVVLEAIVSMARALRITVIGEGVETPSQLAKLRDLGCTWVQGYAVARPMPAGEVDAFLDEQRTLARAVERPTS
jgi:diguanylate cyclase (GGDEF)-like protein/PAS domain S-box-containing protein